MEIEIAKLTPYEPAAARPSYEYIRSMLRGGREDEIERPKIIQIEGEWMVRDGNSTVKAYKDEKSTVVDCVVDVARDQERQKFVDALQDNREFKGFENMPIVASKSERAKMYTDP